LIVTYIFINYLFSCIMQCAMWFFCMLEGRHTDIKYPSGFGNLFSFWISFFSIANCFIQEWNNIFCSWFSSIWEQLYEFLTSWHDLLIIKLQMMIAIILCFIICWKNHKAVLIIKFVIKTYNFPVEKELMSD